MKNWKLYVGIPDSISKSFLSLICARFRSVEVSVRLLSASGFDFWIWFEPDYFRVYSSATVFSGCFTFTQRQPGFFVPHSSFGEFWVAYLPAEFNQNYRLIRATFTVERQIECKIRLGWFVGCDCERSLNQSKTFKLLRACQRFIFDLRKLTHLTMQMAARTPKMCLQYQAYRLWAAWRSPKMR